MNNLFFYTILIVSLVLFLIGIYGVLTRRNAIGILMAIEI
ncbi:MAG: NADH-quinone oxidoreductase subunit K, partial [Candidatus Firestonebacteria bacterium]